MSHENTFPTRSILLASIPLPVCYASPFLALSHITHQLIVSTGPYFKEMSGWVHCQINPLYSCAASSLVHIRMYDNGDSDRPTQGNVSDLTRLCMGARNTKQFIEGKLRLHKSGSVATGICFWSNPRLGHGGVLEPHISMTSVIAVADLWQSKSCNNHSIINIMSRGTGVSVKQVFDPC